MTFQNKNITEKLSTELNEAKDEVILLSYSASISKP
jgi:hypothetical protein